MTIMNYVLIILASINYSDGGVALSSSEFKNQTLCEIARIKVMQELKIKTNYGKVSAVCLKKS